MQSWHSSGDEHFLSRQFRLETAGEDEATLDLDSHVCAYRDKRVDENFKCKTLKKLFHSLEFNLMDGPDTCGM